MPPGKCQTIIEYKPEGARQKFDILENHHDALGAHEILIKKMLLFMD